VLGSLIYSFSARSSDFYFRVPSVFLLPKSDLGCFLSLAQSGTWASVSHRQLISIWWPADIRTGAGSSVRLVAA
jgi:hypothetical protein